MSKRLLGRFINERKQRDPDVEVAVATKYGVLPWRLGRQSVISALKDSLARLGLSSVELYQLHWPGIWGNEVYIDGLGDAVEQGLVKAVGVSNYSEKRLRDAYDKLKKRGIPLASNQVNYSLIYRNPEENGVKAACDELGITLIAYSPLAQGALTGKYTPNNTPSGPRGQIYTCEFLTKLQPLINRIKEIGDGYGKTPTQGKEGKISPSPCDNLPASPPLDSLHHKSVAHNLELSPYKSDGVPSLLEFPAETSPHVPEGPRAKEVLAEEIENYDHVPARSIISSRWANDDVSPPDAGEVSDSEQKLKRKLAYESAAVREHMKLITPEIQEVRIHSSERTRGRSCGSDKHVVRSSSRDVIDKDEMEIDDDHKYDANGRLSDTESEDDRSFKGTPDSALSPTRSVNMLQGCRNVDEFERLNKISEGTYGVVYRARDKKTGEIVALKKVKMEKEREGFPLTSLREINILLSLRHPSVVDVKEVVVGNNLDSIFMVMEYMEHDLKGLMETMKQPFSQSEVKCLMLQLLEGISFLHDNWVLHRDLKTSNLLLNNCGELKICDLGLARQYGSPLKPYTQLVVTLWYRAPELLLGAKQYSTAIDMWSLGCIMAELLSREPLFNGKTEVDQLDKIFKILGTPNETIWPGLSNLPGAKVNFVKHRYNLLRKKFPATSFTGSPVLSDAGFDLLNSLLTYDPEKRITAEAALNHAWFREVPLPKSKEFMPTFPAQHARKVGKMTFGGLLAFGYTVVSYKRASTTVTNGCLSVSLETIDALGETYMVFRGTNRKALQCIGDLVVDHPKNRGALPSKLFGEEPDVEPALNSLLSYFTDFYREVGFSMIYSGRDRIEPPKQFKQAEVHW